MVQLTAVSRGFGRDLPGCLDTAERLIADARGRGDDLLVFPEAALGGYLAALDAAALCGLGAPTGSGAGPLPEPAALPTERPRGAAAAGSVLPPALHLDGPEITRLVRAAGPLTVCVGLCEAQGGARFNTAVVLTGDGVLGAYRKVHQPLGEGAAYSAGDAFPVFDTPVGRLGMLICYDKAFPEAARTLALDDASIVACLSAWPASRTDPAPVLADDRWAQRFDLCDRARALDNQLVWVASNQAGSFGSLRFVGNAKVVDPGGAVLACTGTAAGLATARVDVPAAIAGARRAMSHLRDRRPDLYGDSPPPGQALRRAG